MVSCIDPGHEEDGDITLGITPDNTAMKVVVLRENPGTIDF